jgi:hypothetical protein
MKRPLLVALSCLATTCLTVTAQHLPRSTTTNTSSDDAERWHPVIQEFRYLIEGDAEIYMGFNQMFDEIPKTQEYLMDPSGLRPQVSRRSNFYNRCDDYFG